MLRLSTGLRNALNNGLGFQGIFNKGFINVYTGSQPANADNAATGTLLGVVSSGGLAPTFEVPATGTITLATGAAGSVNTVTVGGFNIIPDGAVPFNTSLAQTAADLCDAINRNGHFLATVSGAAVTITPRPGSGAAYNSAVVTATLTTLTATYANMSGGADSANGLLMGPSAGGVISKLPAQNWRFNGLAAGTAGWFRFIQCRGDDGLAAVAPWQARLDGTIGVGSGDASIGNATVAVGLPNTIDVFTWTQLAQ